MKQKAKKEEVKCSGKTETVTIRMNAKIKERVAKKSYSLGFTLSSYLNDLAEKSLKNVKK